MRANLNLSFDTGKKFKISELKKHLEKLPKDVKIWFQVEMWEEFDYSIILNEY